MHKAAQGIGSGRLAWIALLGTATLALAGCGGDDSGVSGSTAASSSSGTPSTVADTAPSSGSSTSTGGSSSSGSSGSTGGSSSSSSSVTLNWTAPTANSNGSTITNLAGYKIHYGTASQDYTEVVAVNNPSLNRYVIDSLPNGTYYFAITAYNSAGVESPMSGEVTTSVD
jgi:Fibronectin type III domain